MSPSEMEDEQLQHAIKAQEPSSVHAKISINLRLNKGGLSSSRNRRNTNRLDASNAVALLSTGVVVVGSQLVNYNTVELTMLGVDTLIAIAGICFESQFLDSSYFSATRDALTVLTMGLIVFSLVYFAAVVLIDVQSMWASTESAGRKERKVAEAKKRNEKRKSISAARDTMEGGATSEGALRIAAMLEQGGEEGGGGLGGTGADGLMKAQVSHNPMFM